MCSFGHKYLWILSDDDLLKGGAVDSVLEILENNMDILFLTHSKIESLDVENWSQANVLKNNIYTSDGAGTVLCDI